SSISVAATRRTPDVSAEDMVGTSILRPRARQDEHGMARRLRQPVRVARVERDAEERTGHAPLPVILAEDRHGRLGLELPDCQVLATTPASQLDPARGA